MTHLDVSYQDGCTALIHATDYERAGIRTLLLDRGARIDLPDKVEYARIVTLLLDRGASIDLADKVCALSVKIVISRTCSTD
jgi:Ankyrin repeat